MPRELERLLLHPIVMLSLATWALNDHVLKDALHNGLTGKLSDVTSLIVAPVLLANATALLGLGRRRPFALLVFWSLAMAAVMTAIKLSPLAADGYRYGLAALQWPFRSALALSLRPLTPVYLALDPSDLWTLPAAAVPVLLAWRAGGGARTSLSDPCEHAAAA
jgi:hypothetical protein